MMTADQMMAESTAIQRRIINGEHALKSYMTEGIEDFVVLDYELEYKD